jgi:hypothetical protein
VSAREFLEPLLQFTPVPKISIAEDGDFRSREGDIWASRKIGHIHAISQSAAMQGAT